MKTIKDLIGKTIASAVVMKRPEYDDEAWLELTFTDGTDCMIVGGYGGYTGASEDEYPAVVFVSDKVDGLTAVEAP